MRDGSGRWLPSHWRHLLAWTLESLDSVSARFPEVEWTFGGGTALAFDLGHRISYDIDAFLSSSHVAQQLVPVVNETTKRICWNETTGMADFQWPGSYLKLIVNGIGEIDFLTASTVVPEPTVPFLFGDREIRRERPAEILAKKILYRGSRFKTRDVFDLACVHVLRPAELEHLTTSPFLDRTHLDRVAYRIEHRMDAYRREIDQDVNPTIKGRAYVDDAPALALEALATMSDTLARRDLVAQSTKADVPTPVGRRGP